MWFKKKEKKEDIYVGETEVCMLPQAMCLHLFTGDWDVRINQAPFLFWIRFSTHFEPWLTVTGEKEKKKKKKKKKQLRGMKVACDLHDLHFWVVRTD